MRRQANAICAAVAGLMAAGLAIAHDPPAPAAMEKCFGVAKAGQNDCGTRKHDCATLGKVDRDPEDWKMVPKGSCVKQGGRVEQPKTG